MHPPGRAAAQAWTAAVPSSLRGRCTATPAPWASRQLAAPRQRPGAAGPRLRLGWALLRLEVPGAIGVDLSSDESIDATITPLKDLRFDAVLAVKNLFGQELKVQEMQSEGGAAGAGGG